MCLWPHDPLTLWKKQRGLGSNPSSAPCWRGWMSSSCPQGFCLAMDNRNSTTDFRLLGGGAEECHRRKACDCVQRQGVAHRMWEPCVRPLSVFASIYPPRPHKQESSNSQCRRMRPPSRKSQEAVYSVQAGALERGS